MPGARRAASRLLAAPILLASFAPSAWARADEPCSLPLHRLTEPPPGMRFAPRTETNANVFAIASPSDGGTIRGTGGRSRAIQEGVFGGLPSGVQFPLPVIGVAVGYAAFGDGLDPSGRPLPNFDLLVTFYDSFNIAGPPPFASNVIGSFRLNNITPAWGSAQWYQTPILLADRGAPPLMFPHSRFAYEYRILETGTNNLWGTTLNTGAPSSVDQIVPLVKGPGNSQLIGSGASQYLGNDPAAQGTPAYADLAPTILGSASNQRNVYLRLQAELPIVDIFPQSFGTLACQGGPAVRTDALLPAAVSWWSFRIASPASVSDRTFLDLSVGSADGSVNVDIGLYGSEGDLIAVSRDEGNGVGALLTFGHGRRPAMGDSIQGDGRNGDLAPGEYYFALAGAGAVFAPSGFGVDAGDATDFGELTLVINHNTGTTPCPLPAPAAPTAQDLGVLRAGPAQAQATPGLGAVSWLRFTLDRGVTPANGEFLDVLAPDPIPLASTIALYASDGSLLAQAGGLGGELISFAGPGAPGHPSGGNAGQSLPAGLYYLGVGIDDAAFGADGWQARSFTGSRLNVNLTLRTRPCPVDFNADGFVDPDDLSDAIACYFDLACVFDYDASGAEDPDDLSTFISDYFDAGFCRP